MEISGSVSLRLIMVSTNFLLLLLPIALGQRPIVPELPNPSIAIAGAPGVETCCIDHKPQNTPVNRSIFVVTLFHRGGVFVVRLQVRLTVENLYICI